MGEGLPRQDQDRYALFRRQPNLVRARSGGRIELWVERAFGEDIRLEERLLAVQILRARESFYKGQLPGRKDMAEKLEQSLKKTEAQLHSFEKKRATFGKLMLRVWYGDVEQNPSWVGLLERWDGMVRKLGYETSLTRLYRNPFLLGSVKGKPRLGWGRWRLFADPVFCLSLRHLDTVLEASAAYEQACLAAPHEILRQELGSAVHLARTEQEEALHFLEQISDLNLVALEGDLLEESVQIWQKTAAANPLAAWKRARQRAESEDDFAGFDDHQAWRDEAARLAHLIHADADLALDAVGEGLFGAIEAMVLRQKHEQSHHQNRESSSQTDPTRKAVEKGANKTGKRTDNIIPFRRWQRF